MIVPARCPRTHRQRQQQTPRPIPPQREPRVRQQIRRDRHRLLLRNPVVSRASLRAVAWCYPARPYSSDRTIRRPTRPAFSNLRRPFHRASIPSGSSTTRFKNTRIRSPLLRAKAEFSICRCLPSHRHQPRLIPQPRRPQKHWRPQIRRHPRSHRAPPSRNPTQSALS